MERRKTLEVEGCRDLLDFRYFVNDLIRLPDEVRENSNGNRVAVWKYGSKKDLNLTFVDGGNGHIDNCSVVIRVEESPDFLAGAVFINVLASAISRKDVDGKALMAWLQKNLMNEGESKFFGNAHVKILQIAGTSALVRIS